MAWIWKRSVGQVRFSCMYPTTLHFQSIFFKFALQINWTLFQTPVNFYHLLVTFVAIRGPNCIFSCMCPPTLSFQPTVSKFAAIIHWTTLQTPVHFCHHLWPLGGQMHCGHWGTNFVEHDLCSRCGGGVRGLHHRPMGIWTLLVLFIGVAK